MTFATETWAAASRWCSPRIASSAVCRSTARCASRPLRTAERRGPYSRTRWRSWTTKRGVERARQRRGHALPRGVDPRHVRVGRAPGRAGGERLVREPPEVLDERELQHARPRPELADGERGDRLEGVQPAHELGAVEAAVAVADQLDRERVDAGVPRLLPRGELGQLAVVAAREVLADVPDLGGDEVVVVEEPLRRGGDELAAVHVAGERAVRLAQHADVVVEAREDAPRRASRRVHREAGRERAGPLVEALDAEQLVPERLLRDRPRAARIAEERRVELRRHEHAPSGRKSARHRGDALGWRRAGYSRCGSPPPRGRPCGQAGGRGLQLEVESTWRAQVAQTPQEAGAGARRAPERALAYIWKGRSAKLPALPRPP